MCAVQAVAGLDLQHLELQRISFGKLAPYLSPSLTSLTTDAELPLDSASVKHALPRPLPLLRSLAIRELAALPADIPAAFSTLEQQLQQLTSLTLAGPSFLRGPLSKAGRLEQAAGQGPYGLSHLSKLQHLCLDSIPMMHLLAADLPTLPALTSLALPQVLPPNSIAHLAALGGLRSLRLGPRMSMREKGALRDVLAAARQLRGLTELVLLYGDLEPWNDGVSHVFDKEMYGALVPPPILLRRLVVPDWRVLPEAVRLLGGQVDDVCCPSPMQQALGA
jgi:hypothetical protein